LFLLDLNGCGCVGQYLNWVAFFQVGLANLGSRRFSRELPVRRGVADERIGDRFLQFMAQRGHVLEAGAEEPGRDPAGILGDPPALREYSIQEERVEAKNAASTRSVGIVDVEVEQESVWEQRHVHAVGGEIAQIDFVDHNVVKEEIEEWTQHEHKGAAIS